MMRTSNCASQTTTIAVFGLVGTVLFSAGCVGLYRDFDDLAPIANIHFSGPGLNAAAMTDQESAAEEPSQGMPDVGDDDPSISEPIEPRNPRSADAADAAPRPAEVPTQQDAGRAQADGGVEVDATVPDSGADASERRDATGDVSGPDASSGSDADGQFGKGVAKRIAAPPLDGKLDYQMGKTYPPDGAIKIVVRAHTQARVEGSYNICELSGFRVHEQDRDPWLQQRPDLILRDARGIPVVDRYSSLLMDIRTGEKRAALAAIIGEQIAR